MTSVTIYHNPRCSKSRQTLELLQARRLDINIVRYLSAGRRKAFWKSSREALNNAGSNADQ